MDDVLARLALTRLLVPLSGLALLLVVAAAPALAAGPGLPPAYDVLRVDSPQPHVDSNLGFGVVNAGDLNGDGRDDMLASQGNRILGDGSGARDGLVFVISGADGSTIATIPAPDPEEPNNCSTSTAANTDRCAGFGFYMGRIGRNGGGDLGSCPGGGGADRICDVAVAGPDGVPDILATALHVDRPSPAAADGVAEDIGRGYVIDGATFAVLKRLDMPQADVDDQADETEFVTNPQGTPTRHRPWYGRTILNPAGQAPCANHAGVGPCLPTTPQVEMGDLDGAGRPDIVVGASAYKYEEAEGTNPACDDTPALDVCERSGRVYMFRGEDIVGTSPDVPLQAPAWNMVNPIAQADDPNRRIVNQLEIFGHSVAPVGDTGACTASVAPGATCPPANVSAAQDGKPEVMIWAIRADYPVTGPDNNELWDVGAALLIDGSTGRILQIYRHPDPQSGAVFGFAVYNQPAIGDMGGGITPRIPEIFSGAFRGDTDTFRAEGTGYALNGNAIVTGNNIEIQKFRDPTPNPGEGFGGAAAGVGDLQGDVRNEILIGSFTDPNFDVIGDVHFFDPVSARALQSIGDPDRQPNSQFGTGVQPLGDVNRDGFLDFSAGASRFDPPGGPADAGRVYIFQSNNSPAAAGDGDGGDGAGGAPLLVTPVPAGGLREGACANTVRGTNRAERINGTGFGDNILALGGDDIVNGLQGDDCLFGGDGKDRLTGAEGNDRLSGGKGADIASGGSGRDRLVGDSGNDKLNGGSGADTLSGGAGRDKLSGATGNDRLSGGSGNDTMNGGQGTNRLSGGSGNDVINSVDGKRETVRCGAGRDRVRADRSDRLSGCDRVLRVR